MKIKQLLLTALCAVMSVGAWAQLTSGETYYFQNKATGRFISNGSSWGTHATLSPVMDLAFKVTLSNGGYTLQTIGTNTTKKYLGTDAYVDQDSYVWTIETVTGEADTYTVKHSEEKYLGADGFLVSKDLPEINDYTKWIIKSQTQYEAEMSNATKSNPVNVSFYITAPNARKNNDPAYNTSWGINSGEMLRTNLTVGASTAALSPYTAQSYNMTRTTKQIVTVAKKGVYAVGVYGFYRGASSAAGAAEDHTKNVYLYAGDRQVALKNVCDDAQSESGNGCVEKAAEGVYVPNSNSDAGEAFANGLYKNVVYVYVPTDGGSIDIGLKKEDKINNDWACWDNWFMEYCGNIVDDMTFVINNPTIDGESGWTCERPNDGNGPLLNGSSFEYWAGNATDRDNASFDYYQNIKVPNGLYTLSADMYNALNGEQGAIFNESCCLYITSGETTKKVYVSEDSETLKQYTTEPIIVTNGTIRIGVKSDKRMGARWFVADNFVLNSLKVVEDGIYYLYSPKTEKFVSRGSAYGTAAFLDDYGIPVQVTTDAANNTTFQFIDNALYLYANDWAYADGGTARNYKVEPASTPNYSGYTFVSNNMLFYVNGDRAANNGIKKPADGGNYDDDDLTIWQIKTKAERDAIKAAKDLANIVAVATDAGETVSAKAELEAILASKVAADQTPKVQSASLKSGIDGWTATNVRKNGSNAYTTDQSVVEFYESAQQISQTISNLEEGIYKVTLNGFFREGSNANCAKYADYDLSNAYLRANNYQVNLKTWASERTSDSAPNSKSAAANLFSNGSYLNELYTYVGDDGELTITICNPNLLGAGWVIFNNLTLTYYGGTAATSDDYAALAGAIASADGKTYGFAEGEYAPYTNVVAINALNAAKAINTSLINLQSDVQTATANLSNAVWTANTQEMNAVYNGDFSEDTPFNASRVAYEPTGWNNWGENINNTRIYKEANIGTNVGIRATSATATLFAKFATAYGTVDGYTMPLKQGVFSLDFIYGGWNEKGARTINVYKKSDTSVKATVTPNYVEAKNNTAHTDVESWSTYNGFITIPSDGEYVLEFYMTGNQNQIAISDIELFSVPAISATESAAGMATFSSAYPLDFTNVDNIQAYILTVDGEYAVPTQVYKVPANTGLLLKSEGAQTETIPVYTGNDYDNVSENMLVAATEEIASLATAGDGCTNYILNNGSEGIGFYRSAGNKVGAGKAFLQVPTSQAPARIRLVFDEETAISAASASAFATGYYSVNGTKLSAPQKGLNIVKMSDGSVKKFIVK